MEESSSVQETTARFTLLAIKPNQNLLIDLSPFLYDMYMYQVVECLKYSPLAKSTPLQRLAYVDSTVNHDSIATGQLFSMFYNMGYTETLTTVTNFKKSCLPPPWNGLFTLLFKGLSERSAGSDHAIQTPRKRKSEKAAAAQTKPKKVKNPACRLILQSSSDFDSEYVPPNQPTFPPSESDSESSADEGSVHGDTSLRSPTPEVLVQSQEPSPPPISIPVSTPPIFPVITSQPSSTIPISATIFIEATTTTTTGVQTNVSDTGARSSAPEPLVTTEPPVTTTPPSPTQSTETNTVLGVNASVDNLQRSLETEMTNLEVARKAIQAANENLHANVNDHVTQLEAELAVENQIMDELDKCTSNLNIQNLKLCSATTELNDLKSEREVIRSFVGDVHSMLLHLLNAHDSILTTLDILSRIEGVSVISVQPKQGGEKEKENVNTQLPPEPKSTAAPKVNVASVSKRDKKKKKICEDDVDDDDDFDDTLGENLSKPFQKTKPSDKELAEKIEKETVELEKKLKEKELLDKKKSIFPEWTIDSLQIEAIDEPGTHWLEPVMSFGLEKSKDVQFDMLITRKAFIFHCFNSTAVIPSPDSKRITTIKVLKPYSAGKFVKVKFKVTRGSEGSVHNFSLPDIPNLNPHDWILLNNILLSNPQEYQPIIGHIKRMLICYIHEVEKMDKEISSAIHKRPTIKPSGRTGNVNVMVKGTIDP
uniref:Uncharacterized protein n=1 Tax=Lactuca sativa TaxID=4236 RepID=A0A9R1XBL6_LACSA|nr:hypothetical protein LSAT_V11C500263340 [Lactuca sativa]